MAPRSRTACFSLRTSERRHVPPSTFGSSKSGPGIPTRSAGWMSTRLNASAGSPGSGRTKSARLYCASNASPVRPDWGSGEELPGSREEVLLAIELEQVFAVVIEPEIKLRVALPEQRDALLDRAP